MKKHSAERRRKISEAMMGNTNALGCKRSKATKKRMSASLRGLKRSPEARLNMSKAYWRSRGAEPPREDLIP